MLKLLRIQNLILVETTEIDFTAGFNVISGETGSGKSALLAALSLLAGERADSSLIRRGKEKGVVEASFDIDNHPMIISVLESFGIDHDFGSELLIRREITLNEKNRCFVNHQIVQIKILRELCQPLLEIVGQHANQKLLSLEKHAEILDLFGELEQDVSAFRKSWQKENAYSTQLKELIDHESQRLREIEVCHMELEELDEARLKVGEDEELFAEYTLLTHAKERCEKVKTILDGLTGEKQSVLQVLSRHKHSFDELIKLDPALEESLKAYEAARLELQEVAYTLRNRLSHIENNPERTALINERMTLIARLKRKYGSSIEEIFTYQAQLIMRLEQLEHTDVKIDELRHELSKVQLLNEERAKDLTLKRSHAARELEKALTFELQALNMPKAEFYIDLTSQKRSEKGDDKIEFFFVPNAGEQRISIKECASGGELSRLLLGLQTLLAKKAQISTLIFDEIDSNIGGETARIVGRKLREIGKYLQVISITHFPQVAQEANHHIQISKVEKEGRTVTCVRALESTDRETELSRMLGNSLEQVCLKI
jgi:DNA repair protein RecN (Recombination protein N)